MWHGARNDTPVHRFSTLQHAKQPALRDRRADRTPTHHRHHHCDRMASKKRPRADWGPGDL
eukprot:14155515-Alexandrium_andersonii.AAC.1